MSESAPQTTFTRSIRPLTAHEYVEILSANDDVELRISDGTTDGTWRFWADDDGLLYRRLCWTQNKRCEPGFLQTILDGEGTTQLVAADD